MPPRSISSHSGGPGPTGSPAWSIGSNRAAGAPTISEVNPGEKSDENNPGGLQTRPHGRGTEMRKSNPHAHAPRQQLSATLTSPAAFPDVTASGRNAPLIEGASPGSFSTKAGEARQENRHPWALFMPAQRQVRCMHGPGRRPPCPASRAVTLNSDAAPPADRGES